MSVFDEPEFPEYAESMLRKLYVITQRLSAQYAILGQLKRDDDGTPEMRTKIDAAQAEIDRIESEGDSIVKTVDEIETGKANPKQ